MADGTLGRTSGSAVAALTIERTPMGVVDLLLAVGQLHRSIFGRVTTYYLFRMTSLDPVGTTL